MRFSKISVLDHIALVPQRDRRSMKRHPRVVDGPYVLAARDRGTDAAAWKKVADRERAPLSRGNELVEDAFDTKRAFDRPTWCLGLAGDDCVQVEKMHSHGLDRLRRLLAVMLHAVRIADQDIERWFSGRNRGGHLRNPRL